MHRDHTDHTATAHIATTAHAAPTQTPTQTLTNHQQNTNTDLVLDAEATVREVEDDVIVGRVKLSAAVKPAPVDVVQHLNRAYHRYWQAPNQHATWPLRRTCYGTGVASVAPWNAGKVESKSSPSQ